MRTLILGTALSLISAVPASAQTDTLFRYLNDLYEPAKKPETAAYETISLFTRNSDTDWMLADYDLKTGKILSRTHFKDSLRKVPIGPAETFYPRGVKRSQGSFVEGEKFGLWRSWYESGQIKDSAMYGEPGKLTGIRLKWHDDGHLSDSILYDADGPGRGRAISWFEDGTIYGQGPMLNGEMSGAWKFYRTDGTVATEETMVKDSAVAIRCFNPDGSVNLKDCFSEKDADFPGGTQKWTEYLSKKLQKEADNIIKKGGNGMSVIQFVVNVDGKITDVKVFKPAGNYLDKAAVDVITNSPLWIPAVQHNRYVKAYRRQPINFTVE